MPRVTAEHLSARRRQILDAAGRCFGRSGFHRTSMQDILAEAGLSAGALYRYFRSKHEIVMAIADETIGDVTADVGPLLEADPPEPFGTVLGAVLDQIEPRLSPGGPLYMAVQVWGEATHDDALRDFVTETYGRLRALFVDYAERAGEAGMLPPGADPAAVGTVLFGLLPGYIVQRTLTGTPDRTTYLAGVAGLLPDGLTPRPGSRPGTRRAPGTRQPPGRAHR
jgi:AcrR family transcriptional regulator